MGHQFSFYQTAKDIAAMEQRLRERAEFVIFLDDSRTGSPVVVDSLNVEENGRRVLSYNLARPQDMDSIVMRHVPEQGYWTAQVTPSPLLELGTCFFDGKILRSDRAYYVDGLYGPDGQWVMKSEEFRKWAKIILSTAKKTLKRLDPNSKFVEYIGEDAAAWHAAGGKLVRM
jgi:hypothetical protein